MNNRYILLSLVSTAGALVVVTVSGVSPSHPVHSDILLWSGATFSFDGIFLCKNRKIKCRKCDAPHLTGRQFLKSLIENRQISDKEIISLIELVVSRSAVVVHQRNNRNHKNCNQNADHQSWILIKQRIYLYINRYCKRLPFHLVKSRLALGSPSWWFVCLFVRSS